MGILLGRQGGTLAELCFRKYFPALSFAILHKESKLDMDPPHKMPSSKPVVLGRRRVFTNLECAGRCLLWFILCLKAEQEAVSEITHECTHECAHTQTQSSAFASRSTITCTLHMKAHVCAKGASPRGSCVVRDCRGENH